MALRANDDGLRHAGATHSVTDGDLFLFLALPFFLPPLSYLLRYDGGASAPPSSHVAQRFSCLWPDPGVRAPLMYFRFGGRRSRHGASDRAHPERLTGVIPRRLHVRGGAGGRCSASEQGQNQDIGTTKLVAQPWRHPGAGLASSFHQLQCHVPTSALAILNHPDSQPRASGIKMGALPRGSWIRLPTGRVGTPTVDGASATRTSLWSHLGRG